MDPTLLQILTALFSAHQELNQLRAENAQLKLRLSETAKKEGTDS